MSSNIELKITLTNNTCQAKIIFLVDCAQGMWFICGSELTWLNF